MLEKTKLLPLWRELTVYINNHDNNRLFVLLNQYSSIFIVRNRDVIKKVEKNIKDHFISLGSNEDHISFDVKIGTNGMLYINPKNFYSFCIMYEFVPQDYNEDMVVIKDHFGKFMKKITKSDSQFAISSEYVTYKRTFDNTLIKVLDLSMYRNKGCEI